jgi:hypothetical protein
MSVTGRLITMSAVLVFGLAACSEDADELLAPDGTGFTAAEKQALTNALLSSGALSATPAGAYAALVVNLLDDVGTISASQSAAIDEAVRNGISLAVAGAAASNYEGGAGIQVGFDIVGVQGWVSGVVGWNGLDTDAGTVDQLVTAYAVGDDSDMPPSTWDGTPGGESNVWATYWDGDPYYATSGNAAVTASSFSGSNDCTTQSFSCNYSTGTMNGGFDFEAMSISETVYTQDPVSYSGLPAVKIMISDL